jgi:hypothetical protein
MSSVYPETVNTNPNTFAITTSGFWMWYIGSIFFFIFLFVLYGTPTHILFPVINIFHAFVTIISWLTFLGDLLLSTLAQRFSFSG